MAEPYIERAHKQIQIESWSNAARELLLRGYSEAGPFAETHTTNADRSRATNTFEVHGNPISITVRPSAVPVRRGECYVRVTLLLEGEPVKRLMTAYLTDGKTLTWPPGIQEGFTEGEGLVLHVTGTNPAAGAEISETVPTNVKWILRSIAVVFDTDANAANRVPKLHIKDGAVKLHIFPGETAIVANDVKNVIWEGGLGTPSRESGADMVYPMSPNMELFQGWVIATSTSALQVGDDYSAPAMVVEEWIQE